MRSLNVSAYDHNRSNDYVVHYKIIKSKFEEIFIKFNGFQI